MPLKCCAFWAPQKSTAAEVAFYWHREAHLRQAARGRRGGGPRGGRARGVLGGRRERMRRPAALALAPAGRGRGRRRGRRRGRAATLGGRLAAGRGPVCGARRRVAGHHAVRVALGGGVDRLHRQLWHHGLGRLRGRPRGAARGGAGGKVRVRGGGAERGRAGDAGDQRARARGRGERTCSVAIGRPGAAHERGAQQSDGGVKSTV